MKSIIVILAVCLAAAKSQEESTTAGPDGVEYGGICNGLLLQCNRHSNTVACMHRTRNETIDADVCETGLGVDLGRCQCLRNCGSDGIYHANGEFDEERQICVGLLGSSCSALVPHCTKHATCNLFTSKCVCQVGFVPDEETRHCVPA